KHRARTSTITSSRPTHYSFTLPLHTTTSHYAFRNRRFLHYGCGCSCCPRCRA
ncbi:hypothetical protein COCC4DRAFT_53308, partial [Bipolaris maydis ATCC 48331]